MNNIFISYRRADSADVVGRIYDYLEGIVGKENIFKDVHSVQLGIDYLDFTADILDKCDVQLAIIGNQWLTGRRIDNENDLVRVEIETAMGRGIPVIPVLVGGAEMPAEQELPESLKPLAYRNAIKVRPDPDFPTDMGRLVGALEGIIPIKAGVGRRNPAWLPWLGAVVVAMGVIAWYALWPQAVSETADEPSDNEASGVSLNGPLRTAPASPGYDTARVDRALEFVDRYNSTGQLLDSRNRVSEATRNGMATITAVLKDPSLTDQQQLAAAYQRTILELVEAENLGGPLEQLFNFYDQVLICRDMQLCDDDVATQFFDNDAGDFSRTFYPWVCKVRADWNDPAAFARVLDFYIEGDSATVCDS